MKFDKIFKEYILNIYEAKRKSSKDNPSKKVLDSKMIDLITGEVQMDLVSISKKEEYKIEFKFLNDATFNGFILYNDEDDAKTAFENLNTSGELLNFINIHAETDSSIYPFLGVWKKEVIAIKRDLGPEEIADMALEFPI